MIYVPDQLFIEFALTLQFLFLAFNQLIVVKCPYDDTDLGQQLIG